MKEEFGIEVINLTPHPINIYDNQGNFIRSFISKGVARLEVGVKEVCNLNGLRLVKSDYSHVTGLPEEKPGVYYIVSCLVKVALPDRHDLLKPVNHIKDKQGNVIGCKALSIN